jgi:hypothetical protein
MPAAVRRGLDKRRENRLFRNRYGNADIFTISEDGSERKTIDFGPSAEISPKLSRRRTLFWYYVDPHRANGRLASETRRIKLQSKHQQMESYGIDKFPERTKRFFYLDQDSESKTKRSGELRFNCKIRSN